MKADAWLEAVNVAMFILGFVVTFLPATSQRRKVLYVVFISALGAGHIASYAGQSIETDRERGAAQEHQQILQDQNRDLRDQIVIVQDQNRGLQVSNEDLDAQLQAIRKRFGVPAEFDRNVSIDVNTGFGASATVERKLPQSPDFGSR